MLRFVVSVMDDVGDAMITESGGEVSEGRMGEDIIDDSYLEHALDVLKEGYNNKHDPFPEGVK